MAVAKVGKSGGAGGAIDYLLKEKKEAEKKAQIIGGSVTTFGTKEEIKKDFAEYAKLKPNIKNEVVHLSISLKPGEHLDEEKKVEFSEKLLEKTGFKTDKIPYLIVEHHDKDYEHWHIVAGRITSEVETVKEWKIAERAIAATKELEVQFGLEKVEYIKAEDRQVKRNEYKLMERTEELSVIAEAKIIIDKTLEQKPTTKVFVESLENEGFEVKPNVSGTTGRMSGFSFKKDEIVFKSSAIGKQYSFQNLQKNGLDYNYTRDTQYLIEVKRNESTQKLSNQITRDRTSERNEQFISSQSLQIERTTTVITENTRFNDGLLEQISRTQSTIENGERTTQRAEQFIETRSAEFDGENKFIGQPESTVSGFSATESAIEQSDTDSGFTNSKTLGIVEQSDLYFDNPFRASESDYFDFQRDANRDQESEIRQPFERGLFISSGGSINTTSEIFTSLQSNQEEFHNRQFGGNQDDPQNRPAEIQRVGEGLEINQLKIETLPDINLKPFDNSLIKQTSQLIMESKENENNLSNLRSSLELSDSKILNPSLEFRMETPQIREPEPEIEEIEQDYEMDEDYGFSL